MAPFIFSSLEQNGGGFGKTGKTIKVDKRGMAISGGREVNGEHVIFCLLRSAHS